MLLGFAQLPRKPRLLCLLSIPCCLVCLVDIIEVRSFDCISIMKVIVTNITNFVRRRTTTRTRTRGKWNYKLSIATIISMVFNISYYGSQWSVVRGSSFPSIISIRIGISIKELGVEWWEECGCMWWEGYGYEED